MLIIDGYNLIFAKEQVETSGPSLEQLRNKLINRLRDYNRPRNEYIILVFDGESGLLYPERRKEDKNIEVIFSQGGHPPERPDGRAGTADELILNIIATSDTPKAIEVVTSDRELADGVKRLKAKTCTSVEFLERLNKPVKEDAKYNQSGGGDEPIEKVIGLSPAEVDAWLKIFGTTDEHR